MTYALRDSDLRPATGRRRSERAVPLNGLARREAGRIKIGHAVTGTRQGVFWTAPGDEVVESYIQARLHLMGISPGSKHTHRMSEWFTTNLTVDELISLLNKLQQEARNLDQRWRYRCGDSGR